jgi:hypothetical protein
MNQPNETAKLEPTTRPKLDANRSLKPGVAFAIAGAGATIATTLAIGFALASATAPPMVDPAGPLEESVAPIDADPRGPVASDQPLDEQPAPPRYRSGEGDEHDEADDEHDEADDEDHDDDHHHRHGRLIDGNVRGGASTHPSERPTTKPASARRAPRLRTRSS